MALTIPWETTDRHRYAAPLRALLERGERPPLRAALEVPDADAFADALFELDGLPADGPELPVGGVPYLPSPVAALLDVIDHAEVKADDVFVDVGCGVGRAVALVGLLTGARVVGVDVQAAHVAAAEALCARFRVDASFVVADACDWPEPTRAGTVFLAYCPFSGARWSRWLDGVPEGARVCALDVPMPERPWLRLLAAPSAALTLCRVMPRVVVD